MTSSFLFPSLGEGLFLGIIALFLDALAGGHNVLGRVPGPDSLLRIAGLFVQDRLAPPGDPSAGVGRLWAWLAGITLTLLIVVSVAGAGRLLDNIAATTLWLVVLKAVLLALLMGQRTVIDTARELAGRLASPSGQGAEGRFAAARWMVERLTNRYADGLIANFFWFLAGGFAGLLAFRAIAVLAAVGSPSGVRRPSDPLFWLAGWLYWLAGLLPALLISVFLILAGAIVAPARAFHGAGFLFSGGLWMSLPIRLWPLQVMCRSLDLALKADPDGEAPGSAWIGAKDGRARADARDVRRAMLIVVSGWLLVFALLSALLLQVLR